MALLLLVFSVSGSAQTVPSGMTYQGRLTDASNAPVLDGAGYEIEVRLWSAGTGGTLLWGSRYTGVPLKSGAFNLILGSGGTPIPGATNTDLKAAFNTPTVHIGLTTTKSATGAPIPSPTEILPRQQIFSTPYAFRAETATTVQPDGVLSTAIKDGEVKSTDIALNAVGTTHLADASVTTAKLAPGSVTSSTIAPAGIPFSLINQDFAYFIDEKPSGTSGGAAAAQQRRTLNKTVQLTGTTITRDGDFITLAPGTYWVDALVPGYNIDHTAALVDTSTTMIVLKGQRGHSAWTSISFIRGQIVVAGTSMVLEVRDYGVGNVSIGSLGGASGIAASEKYTEISIARIK